MRIPTYRFDRDVALFNLGDLHIGNKNFDLALLRKVVKAIRDDDNARWFSSGDLLEAALKDSKSDCYSALSVDEEYDLLMCELEPIKGKGLFLVSGNHENRIRIATGSDICKRIAKDLGVLYQGAVSHVCIVCGRTAYYMATSHGHGGGRGRGSKAASLERLGKIYGGFDLICQGHTHSYITFDNDYYYLDRKRGLLNTHKSCYVCTGHYIEYSGSYAQELELDPMPKGSAKISLKANNSGTSNNKQIRVCLYS